jgi:hypothetical protein
LELWNFAKQIAQSDGRKNDWVYVVDVYKSIGGNEMLMEIYGEKGRFEVLGEASPSLVLVSSKDGDILTLEKSEFKTFRKKFHKRNVEGAKVIQKSITVEGKQHDVILYIDAIIK